MLQKCTATMALALALAVGQKLFLFLAISKKDKLEKDYISLPIRPPRPAPLTLIKIKKSSLIWTSVSTSASSVVSASQTVS
jgi:hypothetical protein